MFPAPREVEGSYKIRSASRDPELEGVRLAKAVFRGCVFFGAMALTAAVDLHGDGMGSAGFYAAAAIFTLIPMTVTLF